MADLRPSRGGLFVNLIENHLVHGEGDMWGERPVLRDDQREFIYRWCELDIDDSWWWDAAYLEAPKGDGKTMLFAWLAICELVFSEQMLGRPANIKVGANSREQAGQKKGDDLGDGIFGRICQVLFHDNCSLKHLTQILEDRVLLNDSRSRIQLVSAREASADGGLETLYVADEVQDYKGTARQAFNRRRNSLTKSRAGRLLAGSTPGAMTNDPSTGWELHEYGQKCAAGQIDDPRFLYVHHTADRTLNPERPEDRAVALRQANPGISQHRLEHLMRRYDQMPREDFERFHLAWWPTQLSNSWLASKKNAWALCQSDLELPDGAEVCIGIDVSRDRDLTAVGVAGRVDDRWVVRARVFEAGQNGIIELDEVMGHVRDLAGRYRLIRGAYDPRFWELPAGLLADEGLPMLNVPQHPSEMVPRCGDVYEAIINQAIAHDGDPVLAWHVNGAARREHENGWSLSKGKSRHHIDACIAMVLAVSQAMREAQVRSAPDPWVVFS